MSDDNELRDKVMRLEHQVKQQDRALMQHDDQLKFIGGQVIELVAEMRVANTNFQTLQLSMREERQEAKEESKAQIELIRELAKTQQQNQSTIDSVKTLKTALVTIVTSAVSGVIVFLSTR